MSDSLWPNGLYSPWNSLGQNIGVGSLSLLQGIFPTQGLNPGLPHCRWILYQLSHKGNPRILEWVGDPFSSRSSQPRNWPRVSCMAGGFFTNWAIREAPCAEWGLGKLCTVRRVRSPVPTSETAKRRKRKNPTDWSQGSQRTADKDTLPRENSGLKHGIILHPREGPSQCCPSWPWKSYFSCFKWVILKITQKTNLTGNFTIERSLLSSVI